LQEYRDSSEIIEELEEGYIDDVVDDTDKTIRYTSQQILDRIEELKTKKDNE